MFGLGATELVAILLIVVLLFGAKKIPELAKGLGSGLRQFREARKELDEPIDDVKSAIAETGLPISRRHPSRQQSWRRR